MLGKVVLQLLVVAIIMVIVYLVYPIIQNYMNTSSSVQNGGKMLKKMFLTKKIKNKK